MRRLSDPSRHMRSCIHCTSSWTMVLRSRQRNLSAPWSIALRDGFQSIDCRSMHTTGTRLSRLGTRCSRRPVAYVIFCTHHRSPVVRAGRVDGARRFIYTLPLCVLAWTGTPKP
eukprot:1971648-Prymnesium_polylepis.1